MGTKKNKKGSSDDADVQHVSGQSNRPMSKPAHALAPQDVVSELKANVRDGLTSDEASSRLEEFGSNELDEGGGISPAKILLHQVANAMILILAMAMAVSFGIASYIEGGVIGAVVVLNIVVGFFQDYSAAKTMDSLRSLSSPTASAIRARQNQTVPTKHLVPGDLVELKSGDTVPADIRLIECVNFEADEALLTGESLPVRKEADSTFEADTGPGDRLNVAFSSSTVTKGRARGVVFATGMKTEIGVIASALKGTGRKTRPVKRKPDGSAKPHRYAQAWGLTVGDFIGQFLGVNVGTPLQRKLSKLAILLFWIAVLCAIIVLAANRFSNNTDVIIYAVATGLSMIPASLIVVLTITMAAGTKRMVERHVIVRKLDSLEALGAVTDICSDKTGTLTQGRMVVRKAWVPAKGTYTIGVSNDPFNPRSGQIGFNEESVDRDPTNPVTKPEALIHDNPYLEDLLHAASLANLAKVYEHEGEWNARGDPTEIALQVFASRFDYNRDRFIEGDNPAWEQLAEFPFDSSIKKMSTVFQNRHTGKQMVFTKGAVERVIDSASTVRWFANEDPVEMNDKFRTTILQNMETLASQGLRVLALASRSVSDFSVEDNMEAQRPEVECDLKFCGLVGLYDPPRPESADAVRACHGAGISVHMLTGDHPGTAQAIAAQVGIIPSNMREVAKDVAKAMVMTASEFDKLSDDQIDELPVLPLVVARCAPSTKVRMIEALHRRKCFAAMTGDGVNDSPSLKRADIGIAMGKNGSDVAKDASDIVLTDDNFASILNAVEEGRRIFDNIQKFVLHLLAENIAQASTLLVGLVFKDNTGISVFPLAPVEILWVIMITSGMPDMGLGFERATADILNRPPQSLKRGVFTLEVMLDMLAYGLWMSALCLSSFAVVMFGFGDGNLGSGCNQAYSADCDLVFRARATTFVCLTWFALFLAWEMVDMRRSFFRMQPGSKRYFTQWMIDVWRNKFLFWAIVAGFVTIFPTLYIPVLNHDVFKHTGITWEWGVVVVESVLFFAGCEAWKWAKRIYFRRQARKEIGADADAGDVEGRAFKKYISMASTATKERGGLGVGAGSTAIGGGMPLSQYAGVVDRTGPEEKVTKRQVRIQDNDERNKTKVGSDGGGRRKEAADGNVMDIEKQSQ